MLFFGLTYYQKTFFILILFSANSSFAHGFSDLLLQRLTSPRWTQVAEELNSLDVFLSWRLF
jgi:hypothetical protein